MPPMRNVGSLPMASRALATIDEGTETVRRLSSVEPEVVRLGYVPSLASSLVPTIVNDLYAHRRRYVLSAHREDVEVVGCRSALSCGNALNDACLDMGALAGCDMDAHAGAAEYEAFLIFAFRDLCADPEAYAVEHLCGSVE